MLTRCAIIFMLLVSLFGCEYIDHWRARSDLDKICDFVTNYKVDESVSAAENAYKRAIVIGKIIDSKAIEKAHRAISMASVDNRNSLWIDSAKEVGYESFSCPALK